MANLSSSKTDAGGWGVWEVWGSFRPGPGPPGPRAGAPAGGGGGGRAGGAGGRAAGGARAGELCFLIGFHSMEVYCAVRVLVEVMLISGQCAAAGPGRHEGNPISTLINETSHRTKSHHNPRYKFPMTMIITF